MSLEEKRKIKELTDTTLVERTAELLEITGAPLAYEVDWASFAGDLEALKFMDNLACHRLNMALRTVCMDQLGKDAVKESLAKIRIGNVKTKPEMKLAFADRTLTMHLAFALHSDGMFSDGDIHKLLMQHL